MTFDYLVHLTGNLDEIPSCSMQWAGAYHWYAATGAKKDKSDPLRDTWKSKYLNKRRVPDEGLAKTISEEWHRKLRLLPDPEQLPVLDSLPMGSFCIAFTFQLRTPYLSKDDNDFHIIDNPVVRERVFGWPMVRPSSWKGSLRHALRQLDYTEADNRIQRLLGEVRADDTGQAGRLYLYPSFFTQSYLEIINPHDRENRVGKNPILLECVPQEAQGELFLLYVPFGPARQDPSGERSEVAEDLEILAKGIHAMLTTYGFGAKTSSGFGTAADRLAGEGKLAIRAELAGAATSPAASPEPQQPDLPRYLESPTRLHADLRRPDGGLKSETEYQALVEKRGQKYAKKDKQLYDKAKSWWEREGRAMAEAMPQEPEAEAEPLPLETPPVSEFTFHTLSELCDVAQHVGEQLRKGGEE